MTKRKIYYVCNFVNGEEKNEFHYAESSLKKIQSVVEILEGQGVDTKCLSVAVPKKAFFRKYIPIGSGLIGDFLYFVLRISFEIRRVFKHLILIGKFRREYSTILSYSYTTPNVIICFFSHLLFNVNIFLDYEDGLFLHKTRFLYYSLLERIILKISSGALIVNSHLCERLKPMVKFVEVNGAFIISDVVKLEPCPITDKFSILYTGEISRHYGLDHLLKLFASNSSEDKMVFEITGAGEDVNYLEKQIEENELKNVNFHGYVPRETLKKLEEEASAFVVFQNNDSVFSRTNFPSKLFHYISFCKPVFVNRCDIFNKYGEFENVFFIDPTNSMEKIKKILSDRKKTYANVKQQMERYNNSIGKEIVDLLGVETLTDN